MIDAAWLRRRCFACATVATPAAVTDDTPRDESNNPITTPTTEQLRCVWWMDRGDETSGTTQVATARRTVCFPGAPTITAESTVTLDGTLYHLDGPPVRWPQPRTGRVAFTQVWLARSG